MTTHDLRITAETEEQMAALLRRGDVTFMHTTLREAEAGGSYSIRAVANDEAIADLGANGYGVERLGDLAAQAKESLAQVGRGNRFRDK